ncbi:MAG: LD-carboxypeptidase [Bacteroidetes bacterium]|nr:LD-carboxypeptidase [Bacteroidota bacterium]
MIYPPKLKARDKVIIVGPAGVVEKKDLDQAIELLKLWELDVATGDNLYKQHYFFAATDLERLSDLQKALDDPLISAIFCARGGYGTGKILDHLNFEKFLKKPKWIIGFSDITLLHLKLHALGVASIHGVVARQLSGSVDQASIHSLKEMLFSDSDIEYKWATNVLNKSGSVSGQIIGGNLTLLCNNIGSNSDIHYKNKILFIEEVGERLYAIDRYLNQLDRAGRLKSLAGMILGQFTDIKETKPPYGKNAYQIVEEYVKYYDFPVAYGFPSGHAKRNQAIPLSFNCDLSVSQSGSEIRFYKDQQAL